jgi:hypothetical protein
MLDFLTLIINFLKGFLSTSYQPTTVIPQKKIPVSTIQNPNQLTSSKSGGIVMQTVTLVRGQSTDDGTFGKLTVGSKTFISIELPWKDNQSGISCIPVGTYVCEVAPSARMTQLFGKDMYHVTNVPDRSGVCIHPSNYAGDTTLGKRSDLEGCIALGDGTTKDDNGQEMIIDSKVSINEFMSDLNSQPFTLIISNA